MYVEVIKLEPSNNDDLGLKGWRAFYRQVKKAELGDGLMPDGDLKCSKFYPDGREPSVGDIMNGKIAEFHTTNYKIGDRTVNKIRVVAIGDEKPAEVANERLAPQKACVILNGKPTVEFAKPSKKGAKLGAEEPAETEE